MSTVCFADDLHPYECGGAENGCVHCTREMNDTHDPDTCFLCGYGRDTLEFHYGEVEG